MKKRVKNPKLPGEPMKKRLSRRSSQAHSSRFVLTIGDEGAILLHIQRGQVVARYFTPSQDAPETKVMAEAVMASPKVPLLILFDTLDQSYVQQTLPPVSQLSLGKLMQRRLDREFSGDYLKSAMVLGREKVGRKDWNFMMVAMQNTAGVKAWLDMAMEWPNRCLGVCLLPVEAATLVRQLRPIFEAEKPAVAEQKKKRSFTIRKEEKSRSAVQWHFLVSYNKVSGLRQIIFQDGKLMLTRVSQPAVGDNPEALAGAVEQEIAGTNTYLRRLMQVSAEELHLVVIVSSEIKKYIDPGRFGFDSVHLFTPYELAQKIGMTSATQPTDSYGDVIFGTAIGLNSRLVLRLSLPALKKQMYHYYALYAQRCAAVLILGNILFSLGGSIFDMATLTGEISSLSQKNLQKRQELEMLKDKASKSVEDLEKIADIVNMYEQLKAEAWSPESLLVRIGAALDENEKVTSFNWQFYDKPPPAAPGAPASPPPATAQQQEIKGAQIELTLNLRFAENVAADRKQLQQVAIELQNRLKSMLQGYNVSYVSMPGAISETEQINLTLTQADTAGQKESVKKAAAAQLIIRGPATTWDAEDEKPVSR